MRKFILLLALIVATSAINKIEATVFPRFKCFTDRENEYLYGNVKKVLWHFANGDEYVMEFNELGNYSKITYLHDKAFPAHFSNRHHRYFYEGYVVNNYFDDFFVIGLTDNAYFYNPFWLDGIVGGRGTISFTYDNYGRLSAIDRTYRVYTSVCTDKYEFEYDDEGRLITRKCNGLPMMKISWTGDNITGYHTYDEKGRQERGYTFSFNGLVITISGGEPVTLKLNGEGKIISYEKTYNPRHNDSQLIRINCYYNSDGLINMMTQDFYERGTHSSFSRTMKYDVYKNIIESDDTMYEYVYDNHGNWTKKQAYTISRGDIEVKHKQGDPETRVITYY